MNSNMDSLVLQNKSNHKSDVQREFLIMNALNRLSEIEREIVLLRIIKGYSLTDVSIILEAPEENIKKLQLDAVKKLASELHKN